MVSVMLSIYYFSFPKEFLSVLDVDASLGMGDFAALEVVGGAWFKTQVFDGVDACVHVAVGCEDELADDAVAPLGCCGIDGDDIVALLGDIELEELLGRAVEIVGGYIADVDVGRVGLLGNADVVGALLNAQFHGAEVGHVPVADFILQRIVAWSQTEGCASVGESILCPTLMCLSVDVAEVESIVESSVSACEL